MIITIGEVEWHDLQRRLTTPKAGECEHRRLQYIEHGELLKCLDLAELLYAALVERALPLPELRRHLQV